MRSWPQNPAPTATAHLIHWYLGAGKTTLARALEVSAGAVRFSADEWYLKLYVLGGTTHHVDRAAWDRLMSVLNDLWPRLLEKGVDVVLDFGYWSRRDRDRARQRLQPRSTHVDENRRLREELASAHGQLRVAERGQART